MRPFSTSLCLGFCVCGLSMPAAAADVAASARFRVNPIHPASAHSPFVVIEGPVRVRRASLPWFGGTLFIDYARSPLSLDVEDTETGDRTIPLVDDAFVIHTNLAAQLTQGLAIDASWSVAALQIGENEPVGIREFRAPESGAIGDVRLGALYRGWFSEPVGYVAGVRVWAPTGNEEDYMSDGRFRFEGLVGVVGATGLLRAGCTAFGSPLFGSHESGERIGGGCAFDVRTSDTGPRIGAEVWGAALYVHPDLDAGSLVEYMGSFGQDAGPLRLTLGVGRGAGNSPGTAALRVMGMIGFVPEPDKDAVFVPKSPDRDLDGIDNHLDACPDEAGPASDDPERHGCPEYDRDGDGINDSADACPEQRGAKSSDPQSSGCPDTDNDRVVDKNDVCPNEPAPAYEGSARPGCPQHAQLEGDEFQLSPALDPLGDEGRVTQIVLNEVAFILRASPDITKAAIEVRLSVPQDQDEGEVAALAVARAEAFVQRLVKLGVERERLDPVGALSNEASAVRILVIERKGQGNPGP